MFPRNPQLTVKQGGGTHGEHLYILLLNNNPPSNTPDHFTPPSNMVFFLILSHLATTRDS
jgi:hypothetical protein